MSGYRLFFVLVARGRLVPMVLLLPVAAVAVVDEVVEDEVVEDEEEDEEEEELAPN